MRNNIHGRRFLVRSVLPLAALLLGAQAVVAAAPTGWDSPPPSGGYGQDATDGASATDPVLSLGQRWEPWSPGGAGYLGAVPQVFAFDQVQDGITVKKSILSFVRNSDTPGAPQIGEVITSAMDGREFRNANNFPADFSPGAVGRLRSGELLAMRFRPVQTLPDGRTRSAIWRSDDAGASWRNTDMFLTDNKWKMNWYRTTGRKIIEQPDGTLLTAVYAGGTIDGFTSTFAIVIASTDGGKTWQQRGLMSNPAAGIGSGETALEQTSDGRLIAISRSIDPPNALPASMGIQFSSDAGATWTPRVEWTPPSGLPANGIMPELNLQANGALVLSYGRPDNYVAVSWDGTGRNWNTGKLVYSNYIRTDSPGRWFGSSGNSALAANASNSSIFYGDICHNEWTCYEYGQQNGVFARQIDAVTAGVGKLDIATGVLKKKMTISGQVVPGDPAVPEQRLAGAVDGSNQATAAARFAGAAAAARGLVVDLGRDYPIDKVGLMLDRGVANSAKVQFSTDGRSWGRAVVRQQNSTDYALRYHQLPKPQTARYVKVSTDSGAPLTAVTELELSAAGTYTFENDAVNAAPRGLTQTKHALVNEPNKGALTRPEQPTGVWMQTGDASKHWLMLYDQDPKDTAHATFPIAPTPGVRADFSYSGQGYGAGAVWEFAGTDVGGAQAAGYKVLLAPNFTTSSFEVKAWNGTAWEAVGAFPQKYAANWLWNRVSVQVTGDRIAISTGGSTVSTGVRAGAATTFTSWTVSTGTEPGQVAINHGYDDVQLTGLP